MRSIALLFLATVVLASQAMAQERGNTLPEIVIGNDKNKGNDKNAAPGPGTPGGRNAGSGSGAANGAGATPGSGKCAGDQADPTQAMNCLNQQLKGQVDRVNPSVNAPPLDAKSPDTKIGVVNVPGVQQQYGKNFGVSAVPFRPAPPTFTMPTTAGRR